MAASEDSQRPLHEHLESLPQELYDEIYNGVFTLDDGPITITTDYRPPIQLQISRALRQKLKPVQYRSKIVGQVDLVDKWLSQLEESDLHLIRMVRCWMMNGYDLGGFPAREELEAWDRGAELIKKYFPWGEVSVIFAPYECYNVPPNATLEPGLIFRVGPNFTIISERPPNFRVMSLIAKKDTDVAGDHQKDAGHEPARGDWTALH